MISQIAKLLPLLISISLIWKVKVDYGGNELKPLFDTA
jgi:hypothetical protein